ncbi:MAG: BrnT family toxin [Pyrinomonadaceae bacterium MAG19_C2-C3]|nr:BrnT family toxin [Pyrinomonadaceae bacterium MAG19_C2-C3]
MLFEWNDEKAASNLAKHGVTFNEATRVFEDSFFIAFADPEHSQDEARFLIIGMSDTHRLLIVSYTERGATTRIISARETTPRERTRYEQDDL